MKTGKTGVVRGSGNVFRDLGLENADINHMKSILAAEIIKMLDREELTMRQAYDKTGIAAADFSRIRNADLNRFTVDRLMTVLNRLGARVSKCVVWRNWHCPAWQISKGKPPRLRPAKVASRHSIDGRSHPSLR